MTDLHPDQRRLRLLSDAGAVIAEEREQGAMLERIARLVVETVADVAIVYLAEGDTIRRAVRIHRDPEREELLHRLAEVAPLTPETPAVRRVIVREEPILIAPAELGNWAANEEHAAVLDELGATSALTVPMVGRSGAIGGLTAMTVEGGRPPFAEADSATIRELARRLALVLENARVHEELGRHHRRMEALAAASHAFAETMLDFEGVLDRIARAVSESVGDYCAVRLVSSDGERMHLVAMHHPDPEAHRQLRILSEREPPSARYGFFAEPVRTGEPIFLPSVDPDEIRERVPRPLRAYHDEHSVHAVIIVPMRTPERTVGTVSVWREDPAVPYDEHDRILLQDLADQAALSVESARLFEQARTANRAKTRFLALMSHELRTPVNAVLGHADLLELGIGGDLSDEQRVTVQRIKANCRHLEHVMDELLTYARLDAVEEAPRPARVKLRRPIQRAAGAVEDEARAKALSLVVDVPEEIELTADPGRIEEIVLALLTNAVRFTERGEVRVEAEELDEVVRVRVRDTGIGIADEHLDQIFTPFWQAADPHTRETGGTGLGLTIARQLALGMGGEIRVRSEVGVGSTFALILPRAS